MRLGSTRPRGPAWPVVVVALLTALVTGTALAAFGAWLRLAPGPDDWTVRVTLPAVGPWQPAIDVSVARALEAATDARWARWIDGRRVSTRFGILQPQWRAADATLVVRCAPCRPQFAALGERALELQRIDVELRRLDERHYVGRALASGLEMPLRIDATRKGMTIAGELAPTPISAVYALLGEAVPEARTARIDGTVAARLSLALPSSRWHVDPQIEGFAVHGLGTESLLDADPPGSCLPIPGGRVSPALERAVVAAEDQRFAEHAGYDLVELRAALDRNQRESRVERGASTLTQQLAKLVYVGDERSLARKARELLYAVEMERTLGKGRILRLYLAMAPWGDGLCGAEAAALHQFGVGAARLDARQSRLLASRLRTGGAAF
jgi:hypothetical protein